MNWRVRLTVRLGRIRKLARRVANRSTDAVRQLEGNALEGAENRKGFGASHNVLQSPGGIERIQQFDRGEIFCRKPHDVKETELFRLAESAMQGVAIVSAKCRYATPR